MPLPGMTALTIATIAQLQLLVWLNTAINVPSELESAQDAKPTSFLTEQWLQQHAQKSETATSATIHGLKTEINLLTSGLPALQDALTAMMEMETALHASTTLISFKMTTDQ